MDDVLAPASNASHRTGCRELRASHDSTDSNFSTDSDGSSKTFSITEEPAAARPLYWQKAHRLLASVLRVGASNPYKVQPLQDAAVPHGSDAGGTTHSDASKGGDAEMPAPGTTHPKRRKRNSDASSSTLEGARARTLSLAS